MSGGMEDAARLMSKGACTFKGEHIGWWGTRNVFACNKWDKPVTRDQCRDCQHFYNGHIGHRAPVDVGKTLAAHARAGDSSMRFGS